MLNNRISPLVFLHTNYPSQKKGIEFDLNQKIKSTIINQKSCYLVHPVYDFFVSFFPFV